MDRRDENNRYGEFPEREARELRGEDLGGEERVGPERESAPPRDRAWPASPAGPGVGGAVPGAARSPDVVGGEVLRAQPGPGAVPIEEDEFRERMEAETVDGRPPELRQQRHAAQFFWITLAVVSVVVIGVLWAFAGFVPALLAVILAVFFIGLAAWPTWHAAVNRKLDETRVKREVVDERLRRDSGQTGSAGPHP